MEHGVVRGKYYQSQLHERRKDQQCGRSRLTVSPRQVLDAYMIHSNSRGKIMMGG